MRIIISTILCKKQNDKFSHSTLEKIVVVVVDVVVVVVVVAAVCEV